LKINGSLLVVRQTAGNLLAFVGTRASLPARAEGEETLATNYTNKIGLEPATNLPGTIPFMGGLYYIRDIFGHKLPLIGLQTATKTKMFLKIVRQRKTWRKMHHANHLRLSHRLGQT